MLMKKVLQQKSLNQMLGMGKLASECLVNALGYVEGKSVVSCWQSKLVSN